MKAQDNHNEKARLYLEFSDVPDILAVHPVEFLYLICYSIYDIIVNESLIVNDILLKNPNIEKAASLKLSDRNSAKDILEAIPQILRESQAIAMKGIHYKLSFMYGELTYDDQNVTIKKLDMRILGRAAEVVGYIGTVFDFEGMYPVDVLKSIDQPIYVNSTQIFNTFRVIREHPNYDNISSVNFGRRNSLSFDECLSMALEYQPRFTALRSLFQQYIDAYDRSELTFDEEEYRRQTVMGYSDKK